MFGGLSKIGTTPSGGGPEGPLKISSSVKVEFDIAPLLTLSLNKDIRQEANQIEKLYVSKGNV